MFRSKFLGKTRIPHYKNTSGMSPIRMTPPKELCIPVDQHLGAHATPVVKVGDEVKVGQLIAEASGYVCAPIHSPVSGKVIKIDSTLRANGAKVPTIIIENDGLMTQDEGIIPPVINDIDSFKAAVRSAGIVGLGGAGFPTSVKLDALKKDGINTLVINAAECEPYITSDARTMLDDAEWVREGIDLFKRVATQITSYVVGIEANKPDCIKKMKETFKDYSDVSVATLPSLYPQGAEKILIRNTTGLIVPEGKLPADVGVIVMNITTLAAIAKYAKTGMPLIEKCITFDGSAVNEPKNIIAPIGASIRDIAEFAGGLKDDPGKVIFGGPMTGRTAYSLDESISKTTNAIIALAQNDSQPKTSTPCIHCGRCVDICPINLMPTEFEKSLSITDTDERMNTLERLSIMLCVECGSCSYVCPAGRPLVENIKMSKNSLRAHKAHKASLK